MRIQVPVLRFCAVAVGLLLALDISAKSIERKTFDFDGTQRTYYVYSPPKTEGERPLIVLLHGSGRNGRSLVEKWQRLAKKEGIRLAGPDSLNSQLWHPGPDGLELLRAVVDQVAAAWPVDHRRIYLFGHSAGASFALQMSLIESDFYAATATHAGKLQPAAEPLVARVTRRIPIAMWVGTRDDYVPLPEARRTRDVLAEAGLPVELTEIPGHTHWYYDAAPKINRAAWNFLKDRSLDH